MWKISKFALGTLLCLLPVASVTGVEPPGLDSAQRTAIVGTVASIMSERYVDAETGRAMAEHLRSRHEHGAYTGLGDVDSFCRALTSDLRSVSNDKHLFVFRSAEEAREVAARLGLLPEEEIQEIEDELRESRRQQNFGFQEVEILDGNVGYLRLQSFPDIEDGADATAAAMAFLANADAIIIDLRTNGGGAEPKLLASYFFLPGKVELTGAYFRATGSVKRQWTLAEVPGKRRPQVDLYILTSSRTFSAAEDFAYTLQQLDRASVVGERTKGGAHPVEVLIVQDEILTQVAVGRSVNPITGTNWEGVGVQPDHEVAAAQALSTAHVLALESLLGKTTDDRRAEKLRSLIRQKTH